MKELRIERIEGRRVDGSKERNKERKKERTKERIR
jgi:hypothetical protein